ncbi:hypothetical protein MmiHf6_15730 [Methanimicrococcus hongohii]|uniref:GLUG domain-containing protein n=2 Tax=Methanimicrococcus hongohii TaxID=3028295 RepID=A0AA96V3D1_9EURY|nr:hypothetical protein MmiHf6_15730 [Methanimicrococcus sp. Hf6]
MTGTGTVGDPYVIYDESDLKLVINNMSANYTLNNDIALTEVYKVPKNTTYNSEIFKGTFDGKNHTISNVTINNQNPSNGYVISADYLGFFAKTEDATIKNNTGTIIGYMNGGVVENVHVYTNTSYTNAVSGTDKVSGLVGSMSTSKVCTISNSSFTGNIQSIGQNTYVGGIVGNVGANSIIKNCTFNGTINSLMSAGGISGSSSGTIQNCYADGKINSQVYSGGIVGSMNSGTITRCQSDALIIGDYAGGITGISAGTITDSFSTGSLIAMSGAAGISARVVGGTVKNCYSTSMIYAADCGAGIALGTGTTIENCLALNEYVTAPEVYRISNLASTDSYSRDFMTNNGSQVEIKADDPVIGVDDFWDTYDTSNSLWSTWSDSVWTLNTNENFLLPVLATFGNDVDGDMMFLLDDPSSSPEVIYKTVSGGGSSGSTVTITETVYVDSGASGSNGAEVVTTITPENPVTGFGSDLEQTAGFNWWVAVSGVLFAALIVAGIYIRKCKEDLNEKGI